MISQCTRRIMSIASDAPAARTPSVMRSVSLRPKITGRCVPSNVSSAAGSYGRRRKVSITIRLRRHATSRAGEREFRSERSSGEYQEILPAAEAAMLRTARSGGVSAMHHRTTVRRADHIAGIVSTGDARHRRQSDEVGASKPGGDRVSTKN
jgi:hypothetical protein